METDSENEPEFLTGVLEGFYGKPWTFEQRRRLFGRMRNFGLMRYVFAPKGEPKHRAQWRELYDEVEEVYLKDLIDSAKSQDISFVYAIAPGLDMVYSSQSELNLLKLKIEQAIKLGCNEVALLFDDIDFFLDTVDRRNFTSLAKAHVHVSNEIRAALPNVKLYFCPTAYCDIRALPDVLNCEYLNTIGEGLHSSINIFWTGSRVVPEFITVESLKDVITVLQRKPIIWENLHANDYDPRRLFLGPFDGRDLDIYNHIGGIFTNPNNEFESNYIPLMSLGKWLTCGKTNSLYNIEKVLRECLEGWHTEIRRDLPCTDALADFTRMQSGDESPPSTMDVDAKRDFDLTVRDLHLIVTFNYLPYRNGDDAEKLLQDARWLTDKSIGAPVPETLDDEWHSRVQSFLQDSEEVAVAFDRILDAPNLQVVFELRKYVYETKSIITMLQKYFNWLLGNIPHDVFERRKENFNQRGGITAEFERLLPAVLQPDELPCFVIRPLVTHDMIKVSTFLHVAFDGEISVEHIKQHFLSLFFPHFTEHCYTILNSQEEILGVSFCITSIKQLLSRSEGVKYIPDSVSKLWRSFEPSSALIMFVCTPAIPPAAIENALRTACLVTSQPNSTDACYLALMAYDPIPSLPSYFTLVTDNIEIPDKFHLYRVSEDMDLCLT